MIKRFRKISGHYIEPISGQDRLAFAMSDSTDFYDLIEWSRHGGYQGSVIEFFDFKTGDVFTPFEKKRDVVYGKPVYRRGSYFFLQGDYGEDRITLYRFEIGGPLEAVSALKASEVDLYNLEIIGTGIHIVSQNGDTFRSYYPELLTMPLAPQDTVCFIEDGKVYIERWVEEGWDQEKDCATEDYRFYHKVIVKDLSGRTLSEEIGSLHQAADGTWWIA